MSVTDRGMVPMNYTQGQRRISGKGAPGALDVHCHVLFGVDDGAHTLSESCTMLREAKDAGIGSIVCTPHCRGSHFDYDKVVRNFDVLSSHAASMGLDLALGFEVHWENFAVHGARKIKQLCIQDTNLLLLEFDCDRLPPNWQRAIYSLVGEGVQPIIAHPERYRPVQDDLDIALEMKNLGCRLQVSSNFVRGGVLSKRKKTVRSMLRMGLVDYVASDAHRPEDYAFYRKAVEIAERCRNE